jgi:asparagine synthase (glutamine-hydrolysing)
MNNAPFFALIKAGQGQWADRLGQFVEELLEREKLAILIDTPNLIVLGAHGAAHLVLAGSQGVIWGHLFEPSGGRVESGDHSGLAEGDAEHFLTRFWGGYVAVRAHDGGTELLRDPSGSVACYHVELDDTHLFTSQPHLMFKLGLLRPEIDWTIVAQSLAFSDLRPASTALRGVSELLPGVAAQVQEGKVRTRCAWSPWRFAEADTAILDRAQAITTLRDAARMALAAWGTCFARPILEISGGLDSSIVAAGLAGTTPARSLTFGPPPGDPDERPYARAVADRLGLELAELLPAIDAIDVTRSDARHLPRPCARAFSQALDSPIQHLAVEIGVDAFLGGGGGDSVFCHLQSALPVLDRLEHEGFGLGVLGTALDIAHQSRTNVWEVLATAARRWGRRRRTLPRARPNRFLSTALLTTLPWPAGNPWLEAPRLLSPGKKRHGWSVLAIHNHLEGYGREALAPHISPLMSQPILEVCLAIPTWLWTEGGNNRVIAREAFRDLLPASVIDRRTKGGFDTFAVQLIGANLPAIGAMLRDGSLARQGLLDRAQVDDFLASRLADNEGVAELWSLVDHEAWVTGWERFSPLAAPA